MADILVMNGVNLNMFGLRDPSVYGRATLAEIDGRIAALAKELGVGVEFFQTNHEGVFIDRIHAAHQDGTRGLLINAGAWTHYSYALMDALAILSIPIVEVHMSDIKAREEFRRLSVVTPLAREVIAGRGVDSYLLGLKALAGMLA